MLEQEALPRCEAEVLRGVAECGWSGRRGDVLLRQVLPSEGLKAVELSNIVPNHFVLPFLFRARGVSKENQKVQKIYKSVGVFLRACNKAKQATKQKKKPGRQQSKQDVCGN